MQLSYSTAQQNKQQRNLTRFGYALSLCPRFVIHNNSTEFTGAEFQEMLSLYNIEAKQTTVKNPTANSLVKQIHSTLEDQLRTK
jgi:hypothetical protein